MKTLLLMRHAKSSWQDEQLSDFDRPLNHRGLSAAPFMGKFIRRTGMVPDAVVSSPARRAKQTAELVRKAGRFDAAIVYDERIYEATAPTLLEVISQIDSATEKVLMIGHNPGFEALLHYFTGEHLSMPTACLAGIYLKIDAWPDIFQARGTLEVLIKPQALMKD
ncbi:MAG: histidine phosphatase family protein [Pyrinomonadaceae bacterium]